MIPKRFLGTPKIVVTESGQSTQANVRLAYNPNNTGSAPAFQDFSSALGAGNYLRAYDLSTHPMISGIPIIPMDTPA